MRRITTAMICGLLILTGASRAVSSEPDFLAHRGLSRHAPENTLPAFATCLELGLSLELDVYQTRDGHLVVIHDQTVDRTTNGTGDVTRMTLKEVRALDAGSWFHPQFTGLQVPTLEEVFQLVLRRQRRPTVLALNMKTLSPGIEERIVGLVKKYDLFDQLFAFGQTAESAQRFKEASPKLQTAVATRTPEDFSAALSNPLADSIWTSFVPSADLVVAAHDRGLEIWLAGAAIGFSPESWDAGRAAGVDAICTDYPLECRRRWREEAAASR